MYRLPPRPVSFAHASRASGPPPGPTPPPPPGTTPPPGTVSGLLLNSRTGTVTAPSILTSGQPYTITVDGTYTVWNEALPVGAPEPDAMYPTPGTNRHTTQVGLDAETRFAEPAKRPSSLLGHSPLFQIDLGSGYTHLEPDGGKAATPRPKHVYVYTVTGQGKAPRFRINDAALSDNYGALRITIGAAGAPPPPPPPPPVVYGARAMPTGPFTDRTTALVYRMGSDGSGTPGTVSNQHIHDTPDYGLEITQWQPVTAAPPNTPWQVSDVIGERIGNTPPTSNGTAEAGLWFGVPVNAQRVLGHGTAMGIWVGAQCHDFTLTDATAAVLDTDGTLGKLPAHGIYLEHIARRGLIQYATVRASVHGIETEAWRYDQTNATIFDKEYPTAPAGKAGPCFIEIAYCDIEADEVGIFLDAGMSGFYIHHCKITAPVGISQPANLALPANPNFIDLGTIDFDCTTNVVTNQNPL